MSNVTVISIGFDQPWEKLEDFLNDNNEFVHHGFGKNLGDIFNHLTAEMGALILVPLSSNEDFAFIVSFLKKYKPLGKNTAQKVVLVDALRSKKHIAALTKIGKFDILDDNVKDKAFSFKLKFWLKALNTQFQKNEIEKQKEEKFRQQAAAKSSSSNGEVAQRGGSGLQWTEELDIEEDCWLIQDQKYCRKVLGSWLVKIKGPGPFVGKFFPKEGARDIYVFEKVTKDETELLVDTGLWEVRSQIKPEFDWKANLWVFSGADSYLIYKKKDDDKDYYKFKVDENQAMVMAKDSEIAKVKVELIEQSFDSEYVLRKDNFSLGAHDVDHETESLEKNLEGKNHDEDDKKDYSGKLAKNEKDSQDDKSSTHSQKKLHDLKGKLGEQTAEGTSKSDRAGDSAAKEEDGETDTSSTHTQKKLHDLKGKLGEQTAEEKQRSSADPTENKDKTRKSDSHMPHSKGNADSVLDEGDTLNAHEKEAPSVKSQKDSITDRPGKTKSKDVARDDEGSDSKDSSKEAKKGNLNQKTKTDRLNKYHNVDLKENESNSEHDEDEESAHDEQNLLDLAAKRAEQEAADLDISGPDVSCTVIYNGVEYKCQFQDSYDEILNLSHQKIPLSSEDKVSIRLSYLGSNDKSESIVTGFVQEIIEDSGVHYYNFLIIQQDVDKLDDFISKFQARQGEVDLFMARAKGI